MLTDRARWDVEGRDWPNRAYSRFVTTDRVKWHVQVMGSGPVILLIHGTGAATHSWRDLMPLLAAHFTVVTPDMPGHGFTVGRPAGGLSMAAMARAAAALLAELQLEPALIIGHSAGAAIAARMVLDGIATPQGVIGLNAALQPFPGLAAKMFPTLARMLFINPFAPHIFAGIARQRGEAGRFLARSTGSTIDPAGADFYGRLFATPAHCAGAITMMADWDLDSLALDLPRLSVPLLLVHGDDDAAISLASAKAAAAQVTGAQIISLPGLGHLAHEEQPGVIADQITGFAQAMGVMAG